MGEHAPPSRPRRRVLVVDDDVRVVEGLRKALYPFRASWGLETATSGAAALEAVGREAFDAIVSDARMPEMDGATLLRAVAERRPDAVRIVLSGDVEPGTLERLQLVAHHLIPKPFDAQALYWRVENALVVRDALATPQLKALVCRWTSMPSLPATYRDVQSLSHREASTLQEFVLAVEADAAVTANVLKLVNSAWFHLPTRVDSLRDAVRLLGVRLLCDIVLAAQVFSGPDGVANRLRVEATQRLRELPRDASDAARTSAVLLDIGQLVFHLNAPDLAALIEAQVASGADRLELEARHFGITHPVVGAHLLALWGLPSALVEAVALHHRPEPENPTSLPA